MCYRPAAAVNIVKCLECGAFNKPTDATCKKCGADLTASREAAENAVKANAPAAPAEISLKPKGLDGAPAAPSAPSGPKPPSTPGAPKPPSA